MGAISMNWTTPMSRDDTQSLGPVYNFTPKAQQVLTLAREEARRCNHNFVGTEHVLLGLIALDRGTAVTVLKKMGLNLETVRMEVEKCVGTGPDKVVSGNIPFTPRVKRVLALAVKEAKALNHNYVGTEHILLGLLREGDGVAARILLNLDVRSDETRTAILQELNPNLKQSSVEYVVREEESKMKRDDTIDISKRYDVYCREGGQEVVYRNVIFKGLKRLFQQRDYDVLAQYMEIEEISGRRTFLSRSTIVKFCEHGVESGSESVEGKKE